jgi:predicted nucleic acid-binding protein
VSAFAARGICADVLELVLLEHDLIIGQNVLRELSKALRQKVKLPAARSSEIVEFVAAEAAVVVEGAQPVDAKVDADDALVLGEARSGQAEMFVTGDAALLKLETVEGFKIVSPRQFWEALHAAPR